MTDFEFAICMPKNEQSTHQTAPHHRKHHEKRAAVPKRLRIQTEKQAEPKGAKKRVTKKIGWLGPRGFPEAATCTGSKRVSRPNPRERKKRNCLRPLGYRNWESTFQILETCTRRRDGSPWKTREGDRRKKKKTRKQPQVTPAEHSTQSPRTEERSWGNCGNAAVGRKKIVFSEEKPHRFPGSEKWHYKDMHRHFLERHAAKAARLRVSRTAERNGLDARVRWTACGDESGLHSSWYKTLPRTRLFVYEPTSASVKILGYSYALCAHARQITR